MKISWPVLTVPAHSVFMATERPGMLWSAVYCCFCVVNQWEGHCHLLLLMPSSSLEKGDFQSIVDDSLGVFCVATDGLGVFCIVATGPRDAALPLTARGSSASSLLTWGLSLPLLPAKCHRLSHNISETVVPDGPVSFCISDCRGQGHDNGANVSGKVINLLYYHLVHFTC